MGSGKETGDEEAIDILSHYYLLHSNILCGSSIEGVHVLYHIEIICLIRRGPKELTLHEGMYDTMTVFDGEIVGPGSTPLLAENVISQQLSEQG